MKSLRIGILTPTFLPKCSGAEVFHHNLASQLVRAGHHPIVMAPRGRVRALRERGWTLPYEVDELNGCGWSMLRRFAPLGFWKSRRIFFQKQEQHKFDIWHCVVLYPSGITFADWQSRSRVPGLVRAVGDDVSGVPGKGLDWRTQRLLREKLPKAQCLVALSEGMAESLKTLGIREERIRVISNAVDCARFEEELPPRGEVREDLGLPRDAFVFLCVARNHPQKDFPTLFAAFRELMRRMPDKNLHLALAGRGVCGLKAEAAAAGIEERVHCYEFSGCVGADGIPQMPAKELVRLYRVADGFVMSSLLEGFSSALIEAMASALPVVATAALGIREVVRNEDNGLLVPCSDPAALAEGMGRLLKNDELRGKISAGGRETAEKYSWASVVEAYVTLYEALIQARRSG